MPTNPSPEDRYAGAPPFERSWQILPGRRIWFAGSQLIKVIVGASSVITAIVALYFAGVYAHDAWLFPNEKDYTTLRHLGAGMSVEHFDEVLGAPSISVSTLIERGGEVDEGHSYTYIRDKYLVEIIGTSDGDTIMYSVLTCDDDFMVTFDAPTGSTVQLGTSPLPESDSSGGTPSQIWYESALTVGSPVVYQETMVADAAGATRYRAYGFGVNAVCDPTNSFTTTDGDPLPGYSGPLEGAPTEIVEFRKVTQPNFYIETANGWPLHDDNLIGLGAARAHLPAWFLAEND